jgi:hypothetical protein
MSAFETTSTVGSQGEIHLANVPFQPGTPVDVVVSSKEADAIGSDGGHRLTALLAALDHAHNQAPVGSLRRDELYDRNGLH